MSNHDHLPHPMQPVYLDESGAARFKPNAIIRYLFDSRRLDLNEIAALPFSPEDRMQIAQLLGFTMVG